MKKESKGEKKYQVHTKVKNFYYRILIHETCDILPKL